MASQSILFLAPAQAVTEIFPKMKEDGVEAGLAENLKGALAFIAKAGPALIFSRPSMPGYKVDDLLQQGREEKGFPPVIIFTDKGSTEEAQRYLDQGARDYWLEPLSWDKIQAALPEPEARAARPKAKSGGQDASPRIIGNHPAIAKVLALAKQVAPSKASVLITGESGTGKEMIARLLHQSSDRRMKPFVAINCAALPEHLLESELFGHEKGAFTGAITRKPGRFELADGGTILLDEISEMDLGLQAKLLRVLQEGELDRVGGTETISVDVRVLATTNRNLQDWVEQGKFRQDLYFRLNVIPLKLPALRERGKDMLLLAQFFVDRYCEQYSLPRLSFTQEAVDWLTEYTWPGNVRELQNLMERAVLLAGKGPISKAHFLLEEEAPDQEEQEAPDDSQAGLIRVAGKEEEAGQAPAPLSGDNLENLLGDRIMTIQEMERILIMKGLEQTSGNRTQAAELLGISVRTLRNKLNDYRDQGHDIP